MKNIYTPIVISLLVFFGLADVIYGATEPTPTPAQRPRVYFGASNPTPTPVSNSPIVIGKPTASPTPFPTPNNSNGASPIVIGKPTITPTPQTGYSPRPTPAPTPYFPAPNTSAAWNPLGKPLTLTEIFAYVASAKRSLQSRPMQTAITQPTGETTFKIITDYVTLAIYEPRTKLTHFLTVPKESFLSRDNEMILSSSLPNRTIRIRIVRANGVNTAVLAYDESNNPLVPLIVQYPVERNGYYFETAYYMSVHPALVSPEVSRAGQVYVRNIMETANQKLKEKGIYIAPEVFGVAERLVVVEHVDHARFNTENRLALYEEVYSLFALNEGNTYRYAISSAGAGGVVQMIPSTYRIVRNLYPQANLMPDFVEGMRNHVNAAEAMLVYMQMTWNDLQSNSTIQAALADGTATPAELMSAGYNSNPAKIPGYIRRGGANWKYLIPRETQMYHKIYGSFEELVKTPPRVPR